MDANKQSSINLQKFIVVVTIVGIALVLGIFINATIGDAVMDENVAASVVNETGVYINETGYTVAYATAEDFASPVITAIWNATSAGGGTYNLSIPMGNATISSAGVVTNASADFNWDSVSLSYTYTFTNDTAASTASDAVVSALSTGTSWISILVVVGFAIVILQMLTSGLGAVAQGRGEVPYY